MKFKNQYLKILEYLHLSFNQGRNHGIDIGGVQMWALPQIYIF